MRCARKIDIDGKIHGVDQKITAADLDTLVSPRRDYTFMSRVLIKTIMVCRLRVCRQSACSQASARQENVLQEDCEHRKVLLPMAESSHNNPGELRLSIDRPLSFTLVIPNYILARHCLFFYNK